MAIRTIISLIGAATITNTMLAGDIQPAKIDLAESFDFTGGLNISGQAVVAGTSNLYYMPVDKATTANVADLAAGAPLSVDGGNVSNGQKVLVWNQTNPIENGIYSVTAAGSGSDGQWVRDTARDTSGELPVGLLVYVKAGTASGGRLYKLTSFAGTLETDDLVFEEQQEGLSSATGEPDVIGTGDANTLNFDLPSANVAWLAVFVDGVMQAPGIYSISAGAGTGGVDRLVFASGNAPDTGAVVEALVLKRD